MTQEQFHELVHLVREIPGAPPEKLFAGGMDDWHSRARLAHFLAMPNVGKTEEAIELFRSVVEAAVDEESSEDVEEKVFALQKLSGLERNIDGKAEEALHHINLAIELAESTDFLYKYILRGELWADRWNLMHKLGQSQAAEAEADERITAYEGIPAPHNSYLYYGYRFKAHLAAEQGSTLVAKDFMRMALKAMDVPPDYQPALEKALSYTHENTAWILNEIDQATPNPDALPWDI